MAVGELGFKSTFKTQFKKSYSFSKLNYRWYLRRQNLRKEKK